MITSPPDSLRTKVLSVKEQRFRCAQGARQKFCGPDFELNVDVNL